LWSLLREITLRIIPLQIITIERHDLVFNKGKWPRQKKQYSYWEGFAGLWQSPFGKLCEKMVAVSWGGAEGLEEL
jgi:hypothetical protein